MQWWHADAGIIRRLTCSGGMQVLGEHDNNVKAMLNTFGVALKPSSFKKDVRPLLKEACTAIFGTAAGVVDMMVKNVPSSKAGSAIKVCAAACLSRYH